MRHTRLMLCISYGSTLTLDRTPPGGFVAQIPKNRTSSVGLKVIDSHRRRHGESVDPRVTGRVTTGPKKDTRIPPTRIQWWKCWLTMASGSPKGSRAHTHRVQRAMGGHHGSSAKGKRRTLLSLRAAIILASIPGSLLMMKTKHLEISTSGTSVIVWWHLPRKEAQIESSCLICQPQVSAMKGFLKDIYHNDIILSVRSQCRECTNQPGTRNRGTLRLAEEQWL